MGVLAWLAPGNRSRVLVVVLGAAGLSAVGVFTAWRGPFDFIPSTWLPWGPWAMFALEALEDVIITYIGYRLASQAIVVCGVVQFGLTLTEEYFRFQNPYLTQAPHFMVDPLSLILVLIITVIGSLIAVYALGYMERHAHHAPSSAGSNGRFFFFLMGFLGVMNWVVLTDNIQVFIICWEATTLCSFALIAHDGTGEALASAKRALLFTAFGGTANMAASAIGMAQFGTGDLTGLMAAGAMVPITLLCVGALTKSATLPFQSWLLGAMVAPTPVSALLHSATMVKAGTYLILRLAPSFTGTRLSDVLALCGAFTFALAAGLAIGQSNAKRVLAYSTISNLGLIVGCAGINTPLALAAALMILCFHAASKGLLFLCVGTIEQEIGSRDIEDMGGIRFRLPATTIITLVGMASMLIPPFGMLLSKWMAIEASIHSPLILMLVVAGSALTMVFWVKWMGRIQTVSYHPEERLEKLPPSMLTALVVLVLIVLACGLAAMPIHRTWFEPMVIQIYHGKLEAIRAAQSLVQLKAVSHLAIWPVLVLLGGAFLAWLGHRTFFKGRHERLPFLCGENVVAPDRFYSFYSLKDQPDSAWAASMYLTSVFSETKLTPWANLLALMILMSLFVMGGVTP